MRRNYFALVGIILLLVGVLVPLLTMLVDYRVTEALAHEARYHADWLREAEGRAKTSSGEADVSRNLRNRLESEELKLAYAVGALRQLNPEWQANQPSIPWWKLAFILLAEVPRYWLTQLTPSQ
jgi:hypothetical protein